MEKSVKKFVRGDVIMCAMLMEYGPFAYNIRSTRLDRWVKTALTIMSVSEVSRFHRAADEWLSLWTLERGLVFFVDDKRYKYVTV